MQRHPSLNILILILLIQQKGYKDFIWVYPMSKNCKFSYILSILIFILRISRLVICKRLPIVSYEFAITQNMSIISPSGLSGRHYYITILCLLFYLVFSLLIQIYFDQNPLIQNISYIAFILKIDSKESKSIYDEFLYVYCILYQYKC